MIVFFFQAEDGIRDGHVTGVQTCALPISGLQRFPDDDGLTRLHLHALAEKGDASALLEQTEPRRSEERRVGKESRSRRTMRQCKKRRRKRTNNERKTKNYKDNKA